MCPWTQFEPATVNFCEEMLCSWIRCPADTWSNLIYIVVGFIGLSWFFKDGEKAKITNVGFIVSAMCVGIGSFLFHMTRTFWGEFLDVGSMFLFSSIFIAANTNRLWPKINRGLIYTLSMLASLGILWKWHPIGINLFIVHVVIFLSLELVWAFRNSSRWATARSCWEFYRPLAFMGIFFFTSLAIWGLDITGVVCNPSLHWISGHAVWHLTNCWCFLWGYKFYLNAERNS